MSDSQDLASGAKGAAKLRAEHLGVVYDRDGRSMTVLEDINLDVREGEFICLVGPSGAGKSTLLNALAGFLSPTSGSVTIDGEAVTGLTHEESLSFKSEASFPG